MDRTHVVCGSSMPSKLKLKFALLTEHLLRVWAFAVKATIARAPFSAAMPKSIKRQHLRNFQQAVTDCDA
jgi:hypothetical protein